MAWTILAHFGPIKTAHSRAAAGQLHVRFPSMRIQLELSANVLGPQM